MQNRAVRLHNDAAQSSPQHLHRGMALLVIKPIHPAIPSWHFYCFAAKLAAELHTDIAHLGFGTTSAT
jgi:hypothetical protein